MNLTVGIVGLPNVGKSTLFNALLKKQQALAANYPFATIDPNTGIVEVPDDRLIKLAETVRTSDNLDHLPPLKHATIEFVDIAGIVAGASKGEGLGNQFLANIREVDLICHVLRAFTDSDVVLTGKLDPNEDLSTIRTELVLKDLETMQKQEKNIKKLRDPKITKAFESILNSLNNQEKIEINLNEESVRNWYRDLQLLSLKAEIFAINVSEEQLKKNESGIMNQEYAKQLGVNEGDIVVICAKVESDLCTLDETDQKEYLDDLGIKESGIEKMARTSYSKLNLISFLTAGEIEVRAWTIKRGTLAPGAAGTIHTDFEKKFIKADTVDFDKFIEVGGWKAAREKGLVRMEGKTYEMQDGDVVEFKIGA